MWEDPIVNKVRKIRESLEAEFDFEAGAIFRDIRRRQAALGSRLVCRKKFAARQAAVPDRVPAALHPGSQMSARQAEFACESHVPALC